MPDFAPSLRSFCTPALLMGSYSQVLIPVSCRDPTVLTRKWSVSLAVMNGASQERKGTKATLLHQCSETAHCKLKKTCMFICVEVSLEKTTYNWHGYSSSKNGLNHTSVLLRSPLLYCGCTGCQKTWKQILWLIFLFYSNILFQACSNQPLNNGLRFKHHRIAGIEIGVQ